MERFMEARKAFYTRIREFTTKLGKAKEFHVNVLESQADQTIEATTLMIESGKGDKDAEYEGNGRERCIQPL